MLYLKIEKLNNLFFMKNLLIVLCILGLSGFSIAQNNSTQDEIRLLDGNITLGKVISVADSLIIYEIEKKKTIKTQGVEPQLVYSIVYKDGREEIVYKHDPSNEGDLTEEEMGNFWKGQHDAIKKYKTTGTTVGGLVLGTASVVFFPYLYMYTAVGTSLVYTFGHYLPFSKINTDKHILDPELAKNDKYVLGYKEAGRKKRISNALKSSIGGAVVGIITYAIIAPKIDK